MKEKKILGRKIIAVLLLTVVIIAMDILQTGNGKKPDAPVLLRAYTDPYGSYGALGEEPMGWFGDLLQDELNIEIQIEPYSGIFGYEGDGRSFVEDADLYSFLGEITYYEAVKEGKLKNLEEEIKEHPDVYSKYAHAINYIKEYTYEHTGKKGVFGMPIWLSSFESTGRGRECYCISVLSAAKNPEKAMDLITYSASEEGIMNIAFGPEGQMWKKENGNYVLLQDWYQIKEEHPEEKFVETKRGKEDFYSAKCMMELVGNEILARELIGEKKVSIPVTDRQEDNWQNHLGKLDDDAENPMSTVQADHTERAIAISSEDNKYTIFVKGLNREDLYIYNTEEKKLDQIEVEPDLATGIMSLKWIGPDKVAAWSHVNPSWGCLDIYDVNSMRKLVEKYCSIYSVTEDIDRLVYVEPAPHFPSAVGEEKILNMDNEVLYQTEKKEIISSIDKNDNEDIAIVIRKVNDNYDTKSTDLVVLSKTGGKYQVKEKIRLKRGEGAEINWINRKKIAYSTGKEGVNKVKKITK